VAQNLHISQPTLSQQIQQLERAIGAQLLDFVNPRQH
jgi:LysR family transcriptional regulator, cyn operon transcriptional activator